MASGTAAAPPPGTPLLLLIPASALDSAGRYVLAVGTGDGPGSVTSQSGQGTSESPREPGSAEAPELVDAPVS